MNEVGQTSLQLRMLKVHAVIDRIITAVSSRLDRFFGSNTERFQALDRKLSLRVVK